MQLSQDSKPELPNVLSIPRTAYSPKRASNNWTYKFIKNETDGMIEQADSLVLFGSHWKQIPLLGKLKKYQKSVLK